MKEGGEEKIRRDLLWEGREGGAHKEVVPDTNRKRPLKQGRLNHVGVADHSCLERKSCVRNFSFLAFGQDVFLYPFPF